MRDGETDGQTVVYESSADEWTGGVNEGRTRCVAARVATLQLIGDPSSSFAVTVV